ncbi:OLC1v1024250C7 [Oldenlandia corymbosa var. corymbosa]|uniref:OLC1v1024250C7 n=2 Tax=Oldenlandia corymbosa var. corymbosa TaxID=529605 RepID=A0AAV1C1W5_OLDCO|nr:OLC1v1024250C7 [Oldenlandia corymbosa var. corymbosa]
MSAGKLSVLASGAFGGNRGVRPLPPEKGVFPLDHLHLCDLEKKEYLNCLKSSGHKSKKCRHLSKMHLQCRMEKYPLNCSRIHSQKDLHSIKRNGIVYNRSDICRSCVLWRGVFTRKQQISGRVFDKFLIRSSYSDNEESKNGGNNGEGKDKEKSSLATAELRKDDDGDNLASSTSSKQPSVSPMGPPYNNFQVDSFKLLELLGPEKVDPTDVKIIKDKLFGYSTFWVTREEPFGDLGEGILFLGNLRGKREDVFAKLQRQLSEIMGDKYNLFMVEEPNSEALDPRGGPRVSFGMLRKEVSEPGPTTLWQYVIALLLFLLTVGSSVELGIASQINRLPPEVVKYFTDPNAVEPPDMQLLLPFVESALPIAYGVLGVQLFHEVGHFLAAFPRNVKLGIPYFIPNITLGSFGAITQFKSILPDQKAKVDISLAGPFAGALLSFSMFVVGLLLSSNPAATTDLVQVPSMLFQGSLLLGLISRSTLGYAAMHAATVSIHPLVIAGWCGLTTSAFNMLPVGCLDGGRAVQGAFGKNALIAFGLATYTLLGLGVLGGPLSLPWGLYVLICQRTPEKPCLNDVTEVGTWRKTIVSLAIFLVVLTLLPVWDELAEELGIGLVTTL